MRIADAMELWATWHENSATDLRLWYPKKSMGIASGGINCWDDVEMSTDSWICGEVEAAVNELPPAQWAAVHHRYLESVFRFPRDNYPFLLLLGLEDISRRIRKKGVAISDEPEYCTRDGQLLSEET